jgi:uncharacterized protein (DUF58 family)
MGSRTGSSIEFMDHREYIPGDDLRHIDWGALARSDKMTVKLFRDEVSPHVDIILDTSKSMALPGSSKVRASLCLSAVLARASANSSFTFAGWKVGDICERIVNGSSSPVLWEGIDFDFSGSCAESLRRFVPPFRPRGIRVFISDLFWLGDPMETLKLLFHNSSAVFVIQVVARSDFEPPERGNIRLIDYETSERQDVFIDAGIQQRYKQKFAAHQQNWSRACEGTGGQMTTLVAEEVVESFELDELVRCSILRIL